MAVQEVQIALSPWWLLTIPAALLVTLYSLKIGVRLAGGSIRLLRALGVVIVCLPASFLGLFLGGLVLGPVGALALPPIMWWLVIKLVGGVSWGQAFIGLIMLVICQTALTILLAVLTGAGLMGILKELNPYLPGKGLEVRLLLERVLSA